eukprot:365153-Chlamydomonas_euryale.AAC.6
MRVRIRAPALQACSRHACRAEQRISGRVQPNGAKRRHKFSNVTVSLCPAVHCQSQCLDYRKRIHRGCACVRISHPQQAFKS